MEEKSIHKIGITILEQLGNTKFTAMTGAKNFLYIERTSEQFGQPHKVRGLSFHLGRGAQLGINRVEIILESDDTYTLKFYKFRKNNLVLLKENKNVSVESLRETFGRVTGFATRL